MTSSTKMKKYFEGVVSNPGYAPVSVIVIFLIENIFCTVLHGLRMAFSIL